MDLDPSIIRDASPDRRSLRLAARAKINLALAVAPPSAGDAMHPICSWMAPLEFADDLEVTRLEDDRLSRYAILWRDDAPVKSPIDWSVTRDLAVRAHQALERHAGRTLPVQMKLEKRIPVGGGLGGGSADAAAMLLAVNTLFDLALPLHTLRELAHALGSDVAFFLEGAPAIVEGLGERVTPAPPVARDLVLVLPRFACPTGEVYRAFDDDPPADFRAPDVHALAAHPDNPDDDALFNDLAPAAERARPRLAEIRAAARAATNREPHVSGSGSSLFILCDSPHDAEDLAEDLRDSLDDCAVLPTRTAR